MVDADDLTLEDLDSIYPLRQLSPEKTDRNKHIAVRLTNQVFGASFRGTPEIEGDPEDFTVWLWAHLIELRSGGSVTSQSDSGGSVSYQRVAGNIEDTLSETYYGRMAQTYLRGSQSIGVEKWDAHGG